MTREVIVGITGASGAIYGYGVLRALAELGVKVNLVYTEMGERVLEYECGVTAETLCRYAVIHDNRDMFSPIASGSYPSSGMVVVPCTMHTLGAIASGSGDSLLARAADVTMKEKRRLVLVPRETPLTAIHLENMLRLSQAGATIVPAAPGFYNRPKDLADLVGLMIGRIVDSLGIDNRIYDRWGEETR